MSKSTTFSLEDSMRDKSGLNNNAIEARYPRLQPEITLILLIISRQNQLCHCQKLHHEKLLTEQSKIESLHV